MAEIKSTMEKVMERLAKMGAASEAEVEAEELLKTGMRLGAEYLRGDHAALPALLERFPKQQRQQVLRGLLRSLLRNIVLPRDQEQHEASEKAIAGVDQLSRGATDMLGVLEDLRGILAHYQQTKEQMYKQLEAGFSQEMQRMQKSVAQQTGFKVRLDAAQHPKFQEEWQKVQSSLRAQYGRALDQHKGLLEQRLGR